MEITAGYFSNLTAVSNEKENRPKFCSYIKQQIPVVFPDKPWHHILCRKMFPYESVSFHTEKEFDHEFLRSYRINCMNFNSPKQQNEQ